MPIRAIVHASELLTGAGVRLKDGRRVAESDLGRIPDGALVYSTRVAVRRTGRTKTKIEIPDRVFWAGPTSSLPKKYSRALRMDLRGRRAIIPGMVDCHTHLVFAGDRSEEFAARCAGATYSEIAARGGGILSTVRATRSATLEELTVSALARAREMAAYGVRTLEVKSGYGLTLESELKQLEVVKRLRALLPELSFHATFLGAHAFPPEGEKTDYLNALVDKMLPQAVASGLADSCDVFMDEGYFSKDQARRILLKARELGLRLRVHADELVNTEAAALAVELGALSADHLLCVSDEGIRRLAGSDTVAVLLPGTAFYLKAEQAPARRLIEAGAAVALSTDFNPGTSMCASLPAIMTIAALYLGMSAAEIFAAVTYNGAKALGLNKRKGSLESGLDADFAILPFARFEETFYRFAWTPPPTSLRSGKRNHH